MVVGKEVPLTACVRRAVWGMLYADDARNVLGTTIIAKLMTVIVTDFEAA